MCGSYDSDLLIPAILADGSSCRFQQIVICKGCGLVYKNPVIPELNKIAYSKISWGDGSTFKKRIADLTSYLSGFAAEMNPSTVLEVGPGPGWLAMSLQGLFPKAKFILLEASEDVAELTKENLPGATVIPSGINEVELGSNFASLALVCGVDYLFTDYRAAMNKIHASLVEGGYLYIERNVFVEAEAYAGFPIRTCQDLLGQNVLMTNWFALDQYKAFLSMNFDIVSERTFLHDETDGHRCFIHGFLCKKKSAHTEYYKGNQSWYEQNVMSLRRLCSTPAR